MSEDIRIKQHGYNRVKKKKKCEFVGVKQKKMSDDVVYR